MDTNEIVNRLGLDKMGYDPQARTRVATKGRDMTGVDPASVSESNVGSLPIATDAAGVSTPEGEAANLIDYSVDPSGAYRPQEDVEIGELTEKIGDVGKKKQATVDDMQRAQAVESIMSNMIKAFAAYRGFKHDTDMSGVDVKTGIDWNAALQGKLGVLSDETEELKGQRVQKYRDLASRVSAAKDQRGLEMSEAERGNREALDLWRLQEGAASRKTQESFERERLGMARAKKDDEFKAQLGGTLSQYSSKITQDRDDVNRLARLPVEQIKDVPSSAASVSELKTRIARELKMEPAAVDAMDKEQLSSARSMLIRKKDESIAAHSYLQSVASQVQQTPSQEGLDHLRKLETLGVDRIDPNLPAGTVRIPKVMAWEDLVASTDKDKLAEALGSVWYAPDSAIEDKIQRGEKLTPMEIMSLPDSLVSDKIEKVSTTKHRDDPRVKIGVSGWKSPK